MASLTLENALDIDTLPIDFIGFNFFKKSKRYLAPSQAKPIIRFLRQTQIVGVFVNETPNTINSLIKELNLDFVQLHGQETQEIINAIQCPVIKAIPISPKQSTLPPLLTADFLLFDAQTSQEFGGNRKII